MSRCSLDDLEIFAAIARHGSFRKAAIERGVSASALSQAMRLLEERLGTRLLNRTTRSVAVTEAGEALLARLAPALDDIGAAIDHMNSFRQEPGGTIRINAPGPAIDHLLAPLVAPFLARYPAIELELMRDNAYADIVGQGFDAGVRFGEEVARDMIAVKLGPPLRYAVAGSPAYVKAMGRPKHPKDLAAHHCIRHRFPGGAIFPWEFRKGGKAVSVTPQGRLTINDPRTSLEAARAGIGLARLQEAYLRADFSRGRLVEVLADWSETLPGWYLYYPSRRHMPAAMRAFLRFIADFKWLP
ncbi:LysR family transcriptional regulator [Dongia sp.]|uniref:LysR family transcriptional regulator n=1 Tax=Dongia sp. TaxID=1977262 RepID=UPI0035B49BA8